jgi:multiple sugar transport system permease protein
MISSNKVKKSTSNLFVHISLIIIGGLIAFPIFWMLLMTIRTNAQVFVIPPKLWPEALSFATYVRFFSKEILLYFFNSYFIGTATTIVSLILAIFAGYGLSRFKFGGKNAVNMFVLATQTIPPIVLLIPYYIFIISIKLYDTRMGLIVTYTSFCLPYCIIMMTAYFNTTPKELDESVTIDGGSRFRTLWQVLVPIAAPGIAATAVYCFLLTWNEFVFALSLIQTQALRTVPVGITLFSGQNITDWVMQMTMAILGSIPILIMYIFTQKYFISGLTSGAVKE